MNLPPGISADEVAASEGAKVLFLAGVIAARRRNWLSVAKGWETDGWNDAIFDAEITSTFIEVFTRPWVPLLSSMLQLGRQSLVDSIDIDIIHH